MRRKKLIVLAWISVFLLSFFLSCEEDVPIVALDYDPLPEELAGLDANFLKDLPYGEYPENTFDLILPKSSTPTPLVIFIHGGGFVEGEKEQLYQAASSSGGESFVDELKFLLSQGIAIASINYRLLEANDSEGVLKPLHDSKRCLQYIRSAAWNYNIDKSRIALTGGSAGGGTALWLAFHDDMQDLNNSDPVLRESTRVLGAAVFETQATYDLKKWETHVFGEYDLQLEALINFDPDFAQRLNAFYGIDSFEEFDSETSLDYRAEVDMLRHLSRDDPEFWVSNTSKVVSQPADLDHVFHHPFHARELLRKANSIGLISYVSYGPINDPAGESLQNYLLRILRE